MRVPLLPQRLTHADGDTVSFKVNNTAAFFIHGTVNFDHGNVGVTVSPPPNLGPPKYQEYNAFSRWSDEDVLIYFATGLEIGVTYDVVVKNIGKDGASVIGLRTLEIIGSGSSNLPGMKSLKAAQKPTISSSLSGSSPSAPSPPPNPHSRGLPAGTIAGIVVCPVHPHPIHLIVSKNSTGGCSRYSGINGGILLPEEKTTETDVGLLTPKFAVAHLL